MKTTLRQLQVFVLTAKYQNISIAAQEAFMTQAAASMSLSQLEKALGSTLFDRKAKRLVLNSLGKQILPQAHAILEQLLELEQMALHPDSIAGDLHIAASTTIANYVLPNIMNDFSNNYPDVTLQLSVSNTKECIERLLNFDIDIALVEGMCIHPKITLKPWRKDKLVLFCHPRHPLLKQKAIKLTALVDYPWILREPESGTRQVIEAALQQASLDLTDMMIVNSSQAIKNLICGNRRAISCLSEAILADDIKHKKLARLPVTSLNLERNFYQASYTDKSDGQLAQLFEQFIF